MRQRHRHRVIIADRLDTIVRESHAVEGSGRHRHRRRIGTGRRDRAKTGRAGAKVAVCDLNAKLAESVAAEIKGVAVACDVSDAASAEAAIVAAAKAHGPARVLVNCAGIGVAKRVVGRDGPMPLADFDKVIKVNLIGSFNMLRLADRRDVEARAAATAASAAS